MDPLMLQQMLATAQNLEVISAGDNGDTPVDSTDYRFRGGRNYQWSAGC